MWPTMEKVGMKQAFLDAPLCSSPNSTQLTHIWIPTATWWNFDDTLVPPSAAH